VFCSSPHLPRRLVIYAFVGGRVRSHIASGANHAARVLPSAFDESRTLIWTGGLAGTMNEDISYIGTRHVWGGTKPLGLHAADRRQHVHIIGGTGTGKTTLLRNLVIQSIERGDGFALIDPHGDHAEEILDCIPRWRTKHVVYFNPADEEFPIGINLLAHNGDHNRHLVASAIVGAFKSLWADSWGPRLEYTLFSAVAALRECQNVSLLGVHRMLIDARYRRWVVNKVSDPIIRSYWEREFAEYDKRFLNEVVSPVLNKTGQLFASAPIRRILCQVRSGVDVRYMMDNRRIFIANLSKGQIGEDKANLLGSLLITQFQLAALSRANIPESERQDFHLYVDEFHNFTTNSFSGLLSETRKFHLCLVLAGEHLSQISSDVQQAVLGNVGTIISFRVGDADGQLLAREFGRGYDASHFTNLANYEVMTKLLTHGRYGEPMLARTLPPLPVLHHRRDVVIRSSRERYATPQRIVDDRIRQWFK
jgi:hypothetical protein